MTQLFDLNARIQQLTWSLIFYEKYSTSLSTIVLVVFTTANFGGGGFSNFSRYYTRSQAGKSTGPLWNLCTCRVKERYWRVNWTDRRLIIFNKSHASLNAPQIRNCFVPNGTNKEIVHLISKSSSSNLIMVIIHDMYHRNFQSSAMILINYSIYSK